MNRIRFLYCDKFCEILDNACSFLLAFRHSVLRFYSNVKTLSMVIPNNLSQLLLLMTDPSMFVKVCWRGNKKKMAFFRHWLSNFYDQANRKFSTQLVPNYISDCHWLDHIHKEWCPQDNLPFWKWYQQKPIHKYLH